MSPVLIEALVVLAAKYGPEFVAALIRVFQKKDVTLDDFHALFENVKPYESYGIPEKVPVIVP